MYVKIGRRRGNVIRLNGKRSGLTLFISILNLKKKSSYALSLGYATSGTCSIRP